MNVDEKYLKRFATQIHGRPAEIALNGYEQPETHVIAVDDADETSLAVSYRDDYSTDEPWDVKEGSSKRETFVMVKRKDKVVGQVGYRFAGLILPVDLRAWYRRKYNLDEATDGNTAS